MKKANSIEIAFCFVFSLLLLVDVEDRYNVVPASAATTNGYFPTCRRA